MTIDYTITAEVDYFGDVTNFLRWEVDTKVKNFEEYKTLGEARNKKLDDNTYLNRKEYDEASEFSAQFYIDLTIKLNTGKEVKITLCLKEYEYALTYFTAECAFSSYEKKGEEDCTYCLNDFYYDTHTQNKFLQDMITDYDLTEDEAKAIVKIAGYHTFSSVANQVGLFTRDISELSKTKDFKIK